MAETKVINIEKGWETFSSNFIMPSGAKFLISEFDNQVVQKILSSSVGQKDDFGEAAVLLTDKVVEHGPYPEGKTIEELQRDNDLLEGDKMAILFYSYSLVNDTVPVKGLCSECKHKDSFDMPTKEIGVLQYSPEAIEGYKNGNILSVNVLGKEFKISLLCTQDPYKYTDKLAKKQFKDKELTRLLAIRIREIEGFHANDKIRAITKMPGRYRKALNDIIGTLEGGVENEYMRKCPSCGEETFKVFYPLPVAFLSQSEQRTAEELEKEKEQKDKRIKTIEQLRG